jgi:sortase A
MLSAKNQVKVLYTVAVLVGLASIFSLLYPWISDTWNRYAISKTITDYSKQVEDVNGELMDYTQVIVDAQKYNAELYSAGNNHIAEYTARASGEDYYNQANGIVAFPDEYYESFLSFNNTGMMGYITIPKINVLLPIKHYTTTEVLATSVGHLYGSSLPVGGESSHAVLTGHSALMTARLFTDLEKLIIGDVFTVTVAGKNLNYRVDQINVVLPEELELLGIEAGKDLITLVTCTPYAVNTHRLLVRGHRIADDEIIEVKKDIVAKTQEIVEAPITMFITVGAILLTGFILIFMIWRKKKDEKQH